MSDFSRVCATDRTTEPASTAAQTKGRSTRGGNRMLRAAVPAAVALLALSGLNYAEALVAGTGRGALPLSTSATLSAAKPASPTLLRGDLKTAGVQQLRGGHGSGASSGQGNGTPLELVICAAGIYLCYGSYGILQESILSTRYGKDGKTFGEVCSLFFLFAMQCIVGAATSRAACLLSPQPATGWQSLSQWGGLRNTLWLKYMQVGFCYILAMYFSSAALFFINYPSQVIVKSCKIIPVMAVNVLWRNKSYPLAAYLRVVMVTIGIIVFTFFKDAKKSSHGKKAAQNQLVGLALAFVSLLMDGFVSPAQEEIYSNYKSSAHQMMYYTNLWATVLCLGTLFASGSAKRAISFVSENPAILSKIVQFSALSAAGQFFIFYLVRSFSSLTLVTITTTRKFFTVLGSIFYYQHPMSIGQWVSVAVVFFGLSWEEASKYIQKMSAKKQPAAAAPPAAPAVQAAAGTEKKAL